MDERSRLPVRPALSGMCGRLPAWLRWLQQKIPELDQG
jgi:hypothetical protein